VAQPQGQSAASQSPKPNAHLQHRSELSALGWDVCGASDLGHWPYPLSLPGEPLPDEYDLLIYAKNGHRPQLLEHLAELYPRHIQIHYGQYKREQLFDAARRSRACAYLADDDHGPLALQEILLAGCPTVGVRTGAAFVRDGVTGLWVERLPPGGRAISSEQDALLLAAYVDRIGHAMEISRHQVREYAVQEFSIDRITSTIVAKLDELRAIRVYPSTTSGESGSAGLPTA